MKFSLLDISVFGFVFLLTVGLVYLGQYKLSRQKNNEEDSFELLLMGRRITLPLFVASLVSSWYGGISGVTALAYEKGLFNFLTQGVFWYVAYIIFALVLIKRVPENNALTFPELIGSHLGLRARKLSSILNIINLLPIAYVLNLGLLIKFLTGLSVFSSSAIGLVFVLSYSLRGGLRSVVYADVIQFITMILAVVMVAIFGVIHHGSPMKIVPLLPPTHLKLTGGEPLSQVFIWGFIAISTLADPLFYQRTLAAKTRKQAMKGVLIATVIWFCFDCCINLSSLYARAYFPNVDSNESYFLFAFSVLPIGLKGLFIAGIFSAALSSLDSDLFSSSSILSYDFLGHFKLKKRTLQMIMIFVGIFSLLVTPFFQNSVALVWKIMGSISSACLLFPWLLMMLVPRWKNERVFVISVCAGIFAMVVGGILNAFHITTIDSFYFGVAGSMLGWLGSALAVAKY